MAELDANEQDTQQDEQDEQTEWENLQKLNLEAEQRVVMREFEKMRTKYNSRSTFWPLLSAENLRLLRQVRKINPSKYTSFMKLVAERTNAFWAKVNSILAAIVPILPFILIGLLIVVGVVVILSVLMPWLFGLFEGGTSGAPFGVNGADFYGVRYIYRDEEQAQADLWADYANALNYVIENFEDDNITLKIEMPLTEDGEVDISKLNETEEEGKYAEEYALTIEIAKAVYLADLGAETAIPTELSEILAGIKYFGFDAEIVDEIATSLAQNIEADPTLYVQNSGEGGGTSIDVSDTIQPRFAEILLDEYVTKLAGSEGEPTRTDLIYIKDYILGDDEDSTVDEISQENYLAMIYLPKNNVKIDTVTYSVYGVETADFNLAIYSNGSEIVGKTDSNFGVFQEKDEDTTFDSYHYEVGGFDLTALSFSDFEKGFLTTEKSLFGILRELKAENGGENASLLGNYLVQADETNTAFWADANADEGAQDGDETETGDKTKYYTFNYQPYLAVLMHNTANTAYSFTEYETNVATRQ